MNIALYSTIYPGVEAYLSDWYKSVLAQTDQDFELWIGLDGITPSKVEAAIGQPVSARWVLSRQRESPAQLRERCLGEIIKEHEAVVLVDSDDILHRSRVAAARDSLQSSELAACALRLVDQCGRALLRTLTIPQETAPDSIIARNNIFGFSNSTYRTDLVRRCLPIPVETALVDWYMATRAWLLGAQLTFDPVIRMDYRQHGANMAPIRFPFEADQVVRDTERVLKHYALLLNSPMNDARPERWEQVQEANADVQRFYAAVVSEPTKLERYVNELNGLEPQVLWWWDVAPPALQWMWKS